MCALALSFSAASAVTVSFGASSSNGFGDASGAGLDTVFVEVGTYTLGNTGSFTSIGSGNLDNFGAGFLGVGSLLATSNDAMSAGSQLAIQVFDSADNSGNVLHFLSDSSWLTIDGVGGALDTSTIILDIGDLTDGAGTSILGSAIVEIGGSTLAGTNGLGFSNFPATAVPEPSTFAALAGLCALGAVMVRRRRA